MMETTPVPLSSKGNTERPNSLFAWQIHGCSLAQECNEVRMAANCIHRNTKTYIPMTNTQFLFHDFVLPSFRSSWSVSLRTVVQLPSQDCQTDSPTSIIMVERKESLQEKPACLQNCQFKPCTTSTSTWSVGRAMLCLIKKLCLYSFATLHSSCSSQALRSPQPAEGGTGTVKRRLSW